VISETTELGLCLLIPCIFFYFSWEQLVLQDFEWCIMGRVITISDLKEVLKAKTEETEKNRKEARRDLIMGRATTLGTVLPNSQSSTQTKKSFKKLCLRLNFFLYLTQEHSWRNLLSAVEREKERLMLL